MSKECKIEFYGIDFSLAPMPDLNLSVFEILDKLRKKIGMDKGNIFLTSFLTEILKRTAVLSGHSVGFNGVMYSILEDKGFCSQNIKAPINIDSLLAYSTQCGCGLDMVPLDGNIEKDKLVLLANEVFTISRRLQKSLGCRLIPIPVNKKNKITDFHHPFLSNTNIMTIKYFFCKELIII